MPSIGIIDDRDEHRQIIVDALNVANTDASWDVIDSMPLSTLDGYPPWISQNKICALIIDEMLDEKMHGGTAVDYKGHDLVDYIRKRINTMPIYVITGYSNDPSLLGRFKDVEAIIDRTDFSANYVNYVPRLFRAAQQYLNIFQEELKELADYAQKIALGELIDEKELERAQAIQFKLETAYSVDTGQGINAWLGEANNLLIGIKKMRKDITRKLGED